jgi:hypothetical protein
MTCVIWEVQPRHTTQGRTGQEDTATHHKTKAHTTRHTTQRKGTIAPPQILCFLVSTCYFNGVIQSVNTVIVNVIYRYSALLFGYLPVLCSSAIPLSTWPVPVLLCTGPVCYYTLLVLIHDPIVVEDRHCAYL